MLVSRKQRCPEEARQRVTAVKLRRALFRIYGSRERVFLSKKGEEDTEENVEDISPAVVLHGLGTHIHGQVVLKRCKRFGI